jgi:Tol biopolymer transport system component
MRRYFYKFFVTAITILLVITACQTPAPQPSQANQVDQPTQPDQQSQPTLITSQNAGNLKSVFQASEINQISDLVWSTDSSVLVALSGSGVIRYNGDDLEKIDTYLFESPAVLYAASPDGKTLAFSEDNYQISLVDASTSQETGMISSSAWIGTLDFSRDGNNLLTTSMDEILVTLWNTASGEELQTLDGFETAAPVYSAKFGEDGKHIIWISRGTVQLSDIATQAIGPSMGHEDFVGSVALSPDGKQLATTAAGTINGEFQPAIFLWNPESGEVSAMLSNSDAFSVVAFSPDSSLLAAVSGSTLSLWDMTSLQQIAVITNDGEGISSLAFAPNGTAIATASLDGTITLWKVE